MQVTANRCTGKPDGNYVIPDVFSYLECKGGAEIVHNCPANQIFVAAKMACSVVTTADEGMSSISIFKCQHLGILRSFIDLLNYNVKCV